MSFPTLGPRSFPVLRWTGALPAYPPGQYHDGQPLYAIDTDTFYVWDGTAWQAIGAAAAATSYGTMGSSTAPVVGPLPPGGQADMQPYDYNGPNNGVTTVDQALGFIEVADAGDYEVSAHGVAQVDALEVGIGVAINGTWYSNLALTAWTAPGIIGSNLPWALSGLVTLAASDRVSLVVLDLGAAGGQTLSGQTIQFTVQSV